MILPRSIAILCCCFCLIPVVYGQQVNGTAGSLQFAEKQAITLDSSLVDSTFSDLAIPNVFTPNDDQINDFFEVETDGITVYEFDVFTRSGTRVFQSSSPRIFWDGRNNSGQPVKEGVYYYVIEATGDAEPFGKAGFIYLYR